MYGTEENLGTLTVQLRQRKSLRGETVLELGRHFRFGSVPVPLQLFLVSETIARHDFDKTRHWCGFTCQLNSSIQRFSVHLHWPYKEGDHLTVGDRLGCRSPVDPSVPAQDTSKTTLTLNVSCHNLCTIGTRPNAPSRLDACLSQRG